MWSVVLVFSLHPLLRAVKEVFRGKRSSEQGGPKNTQKRRTTEKKEKA